MTFEDIKNNIKNNIKNSYKNVGLKKKELLGIFVVLAIIVVIGFFSIFFEKTLDKKEEVVSIPKDGFDSLKEAIESGDVYTCEELTPAKADICRKRILGELGENASLQVLISQSIIEQADESGDSSLCDQINSPVEKQICLAESEGE
jgi:hypothetical protein|tara:strand:- start:908 stop:1348 length:441 start_codon:yes stop_codon:yes gene_type:complete